MGDNLKNDDIVCDCNAITVEDVMTFIKKNPNKKMDDSTLKDLKIGTRCAQCLKPECTRIDVFYKDIVKL